MNKFILLLFFSSFLYADPFVDYLSEGWVGLFDFVNAYLWVLGLFPLIVIAYSYSLAKKELRSMMGENGGKDETMKATGLYSIGLHLYYTVGSLFILFLIYGVFVMVFAGGSSIGTGWKIFVINFWSFLVK